MNSKQTPVTGDACSENESVIRLLIVIFRTMKKFARSPLPAIGAVLSMCLYTAACGQAQDTASYGKVGMYVANMLQYQHYSRKDFDNEISKRMLENYLKSPYLDGNHYFFTLEDVNQFREKFVTQLDDQVILGNNKAAYEIYDVFTARVKDRVAKIEELVKNPDFTFDSDKEVHMSRRDVDWPADMAAADEMWRRIIEGELLQERLVATAAAEKRQKKAEKTGKPVEAPKDDEKPEDKILKRYSRFLESLEENDEEDVNNYFLSALAAAYDPHSEYFSESEMETFKIGMNNSLVGIGALLQMNEGAAEIQGLVVGGPADRGGDLSVKDRIVGVAQGKDGEMVDVMYMKLQKVVEMIRGEEGSIVRLNINPADAEDPSIKREIFIERDVVNLKDKLANAELIETEKDRRIGWINLSTFYADMDGGDTSTTADIKQLLARLMKEGIEGLVLDLRSNGGGSLDEAIDLTGLFVPGGPVVQSKDWRGNVDSLRCQNKEAMYTGPMVVLTDRTSASASEILAAALQDTKRALIVGDQSTFGKGTVQTIIPVKRYMSLFSDKSRAGALKVTIRKFYRISGDTTQNKGVIPEVVLPSRLDAMKIGEAALDYPLPNDLIDPQPFTMFGGHTIPYDELNKRSAARIAKEPEFQFIVEDTKRLKEQIDRNTISLNEADRHAEVKRNKERREARREERKKRIDGIETSGEKRFERFRLALENVKDEKLIPFSEFSEEDQTGMRLAEDEDEDEDAEEKDEFPFGVDPTKLETIHILEDLIELTGDRTPKVAGE
ncbi:MAG: carboxyl-terminal processing protease [Verrucomicrobiales bacterium]|jgi:carboxyl-terminal processing protease